MKMKKTIAIVVGTRPNFIKISLFKKIANEHFPDLDIKIIHTGQHNNELMADIFFKQLAITPDYILNCSHGVAGIQMGDIIIELTKVLTEIAPKIVLVVGDVNSTLAAAISANKLNLKIGHIESGLRSFDNTMPEETNRIMTDVITDMYFVTEESGITNLMNEGKAKDKIHFVGNTMIDTLVHFEKQISENTILEKLNVSDKNYILTTLHRPSNVDSSEEMNNIVNLLLAISEEYKVVFPIHPRTLKSLQEFKIDYTSPAFKNIIFLEPLDYFSFQKLTKHALAILTDSGGIQEESTFRMVPCLTTRPNTERPITITLGSNKLIKWDKSEIKNELANIKKGTYHKGIIPPLWDGNATFRILEILNNKLSA